MKCPGASQKVYDHVRQGISLEKWKPGDKIPSEAALSAALEVSRVSVRKALDQLVGIGLLVKRQGSGAFVSQIAALDTLSTVIPVVQMSNFEIIKLLEFRIGFETTNVEFLEGNLTKEILEQLEYCLKMMDLHRDDCKHFYLFDYRFHHVIAEGTKNPFVIKISQFLTEVLKHHLQSLNEKVGSEIGLEYHHKIFRAIQEEDFVIASRYMKRHIEATIAEVKKAQLKI